MQPPLSMISSCIQDGKLSLRLMKVRSSPMAPPCTVQVGSQHPQILQCHHRKIRGRRRAVQPRVSWHL